MTKKQIAEWRKLTFIEPSDFHIILDHIECLQAENARLASELNGCLADALVCNDGHEWPISRAIRLRIGDSDSTALADLLAPTIELLQKADNYLAGATMAFCGRAELAVELARLRALCGKKD